MFPTFWDDIDVINLMGVEYQNYATQKPEALLERIIKASSNEGRSRGRLFLRERDDRARWRSGSGGAG